MYTIGLYKKECLRYSHILEYIEESPRHFPDTELGLEADGLIMENACRKS